MTRPPHHYLLSAMLAAGIIVISTNGMSQAPTNLDSVLLQTDAVFFADVSSVVAVPESNLVQVNLANVNMVHTRWLDMPSFFRVVGRIANGEVEFGHYRRLTEGRRYLLFLRGGRWFSSPLVDFAVPTYAVDQDGTVLCAGGSVYGLGRTGLECSTPERQVGAPLVEGRLFTLLQSARRRAERRRPAEAAAEDAAGRTLRPTPVFR